MIDFATTGVPARGPLVVKLGGAALDDPAAAPWVWSAIARMHEAHSRDGGGVVLVHGGGKAVDRMLDRLGMPTERRDGIRLTPADQIDPIVGVLAGSMNKSLVGWLQRHGTRSVGLCLGDGGLCAVRTTQRYAFDAGRVGEVIGGDPHLVKALLCAGLLPVISSIGLDVDGTALNVNADEAAAGIAKVVDASGLILLTDVAGVLDRTGTLIPRLDAAQVEAAIADGTIAGGMIPKVRGALEAAQSCGAPVTIAGWNRAEDLDALALGGTAGTTILPDIAAVRDVIEIRLEEPELPAARADVGGDRCLR